MEKKERRLEQPEDVLRWIGEIIKGLGKLPVAGQNFPHKAIFDAPNGRDLFAACHHIGWVDGVTNISSNLTATGADVLRKSADEKKHDPVSRRVNKSRLLKRLKNLLESKEVVERDGPASEAGQAWLADVRGHLQHADQSLAAQFEHLCYYVVLPLSIHTLGPVWTNMQGLLRSAISGLELELPESDEKVYEPGDTYDVYKDLSRIIGAARNSVFLIDPYADEEVFELYLDKVNVDVQIRLLTRVPSSPLSRVAKKFAGGRTSTFEARHSRDAHDRVIFIDGTDCWVLGQSIKDAAAKKPTYLIPVDVVSDMARLYEDVWNKATVY